MSGQLRLNVSRDPSAADVAREVARILPEIATTDNLLLRAPNGSLWRITVNNVGILSTAAAE